MKARSSNTVLFLVAGMLTPATGCQTNGEEPLLDSTGVPLARRADASAAGDAPPAQLSTDQALRRTYGPAELKFHECVSVEPDGIVKGQECPSAFVVFGPYVASPANSNLHVRFDVRSRDRLRVSGDVVSESARKFHGSFGDTAIAPDQPVTIDFKVNVPLPTQGVEARIYIRAEKPANFHIQNLSVGVE
jgi:hypothetical protein